MQSACDDISGFGDNWASLQFDSDLTQRSAPPPYLSPEPRLGPASPRDQRRTGDRSPVEMTIENQPLEQSALKAEEARQEPTPTRDRLRRGYQACDPCRRRKVKCDFGSKSPCNECPLMLTFQQV